MSPFRPAALLILSLAASPAVAESSQISATQAWSRPAAAGGAGAGYLTLVNRGKADILVGASSPLASRVELHSASMTGGMMRMDAESRVPVPAGGQIKFAPGGRHLMFVGLTRALHVGDTLPATLRFASGRTLTVNLKVAVGAPEAPPKVPMGEMPGMH